MIYRWPTKRERALRNAEISALKKLEGLRLMNELADKVLTKNRQMTRRKLKEKNGGIPCPDEKPLSQFTGKMRDDSA